MNELRTFTDGEIALTQEPHHHLFCYAVEAAALLAQDRAWMRRAYASLFLAGEQGVWSVDDLLADAPAWLKENK